MKVEVHFNSELVEDKALESEGLYRVLIPQSTNNFVISKQYVTLTGVEEPTKQGVYKVEFLNDMGTVVVSRNKLTDSWVTLGDEREFNWVEICDGRVVKSVEQIA